MLVELIKQTKEVLYHFIEENSESYYLESFNQILVVPKLELNNTLITKEGSPKQVYVIDHTSAFYKEMLNLFSYMYLMKITLRIM